MGREAVSLAQKRGRVRRWPRSPPRCKGLALSYLAHACQGHSLWNAYWYVCVCTRAHLMCMFCVHANVCVCARDTHTHTHTHTYTHTTHTHTHTGLCLPGATKDAANPKAPPKPGFSVTSFQEIAEIDVGDVGWQAHLLPISEWPPA